MVRIITFLTILNTLLFSYEGIGNGKNRQESILLALNDIAGQITKTIDSTMNIETSVRDNSYLENRKKTTNSSYLRNVKQTLHSDIAKVSFNGYEIIEEKPMKYGYFIKLKVDKEKLLLMYDYRLRDNLESINEKLTSTSSPFKQYIIVKESNLNNLYIQMELMFAIDSSYTIKKYKKSLDYFRSILNKSFDVNIESNNEQAKSVVKNILTQKGFTESLNGKISFKVKLSPFNERKYKNGEYSVSSNVYISVIESGKTVLTKSFHLTGGDLDKYYAKQTFFEKLDKEIQRHIKDIL